jgi:hypothetical protein
VLLLWIAGLTVGAHLIIPHDHHSDESFIEQDVNCPASGHESGHRSGLPLHCHAFNDVTSERLKPIQISENIRFSLVIFSILTDKSSIVLSSSHISSVELSKPFIDSGILKFSAFRAPPALV